MTKPFFLRFIFSTLLIWIIVRGGIYLLPGDPAEYLANESLVPISANQMRASLHLDQTFLQRITSLPQSQSLINRVDAVELLKPAIQKTVELTTLSFSLAFFITVFFLCCSFYLPTASVTILTLTTFMASIPLSVLSPLLILVLCVKMPLFPITQSPWLPSFCLATHLAALWFKSIQKKIDHFLPQSAVLGARARGVPEIKVFFNYLFMPVLGSIASFLGTELGSLLSGSVLVEMVFQWNGIGVLLIKSVHQRDYPLIEITLLITTLFSVFAQQLGYWVQKRLGVHA